MEGRKLNLYDPLPSIRRIPSFIERSSEIEFKKTTITRPELRSCPSTKQETPVFVLTDQSFDHLTESASVPFVWEQIPGKPKDDMATLIQESGLLETDEEGDEDEDEDEDLDTVPSNQSFSVNCSTSGVSEIEKNGERSDADEKSRESLDLMMSRFLPAAKAMAFTHTKHQSSSSYNSSEQKLTTPNREALVIRQRSQLVSEHEHFAIVQSLYDDLNIDDDDDDDDEDEDGDDYGHGDHKICPDVTKKACGFLPRLCAKNSFKFLNPVPLDSRSNRVMPHSGEQTGLPNWSTRRLSGFISPYRTSCSETGFLGTPEKPESFKRLNRGISKSQELYPTRTRREVLPNYSNSGEIRMFRNSISTPSRTQRTTMHDSRFLAEEVNRRRNDRSGNLLKTSPEYTPAISPPPLPETPSRPWLRRTLLPPVSPRPYAVVSGQFGTKKLNQEVLESTKWETIVKTSYVHNDHARYSQELIIHPSRQQNT